MRLFKIRSCYLGLDYFVATSVVPGCPHCEDMSMTNLFAMCLMVWLL